MRFKGRNVLDDEVHQFVLQHIFGVSIRNEEGEVIAFDGLPTENDEAVCALSQEAGELLNVGRYADISISARSCTLPGRALPYLVRQYLLDLVRLLDLYADADGVDRGLHQDLFICVSRHYQRNE